jgi:hypothetical protein
MPNLGSKERAMRISRKGFVSAAALGLSAATLPSESAAQSAQPSGLHFHVLKPTEFERAAMMRVLQSSKSNKQVFQSVSPLQVAGVASVYLHMQNSMNAFEFSLEQGPGSLATLAVLTGPSIVFSLSNAMWQKYGFGDAFKLAATNTYYTAKSLRRTASPDDPDGIYQDWSAQAVLHRGGAFMVCHNAMTAVAGLIAQKAGLQAAAVLAEFERSTLPGFLVVPAGVATTQLAIEHGWAPYPII